MGPIPARVIQVGFHAQPLSRRSSTGHESPAAAWQACFSGGARLVSDCHGQHPPCPGRKTRGRAVRGSEPRRHCAGSFMALTGFS